MGKPILLLMLASLCLSSCAYKLASYEELMVGSPASGNKCGENEVAITYLGTSGYLIEHDKTALAVDPYFSRYDLRTIMLNGPIPCKTEEIEWASEQACFPSSIDAWFITHAHFDHALDIPCMQRQYGGKIYSSRTGRALMKASGVPARQARIVEPCDSFQVGAAQITVLGATHEKIFGQLPYPGALDGDIPPPVRAKDWKLGQPLSYLIEVGGKTIYIDSGGTEGNQPDPRAKGADLAILGVALPGSQARYADAVRCLCPKYILPNHQDNFFESLRSGFQFGTTANFPKVLATHRAENLPGQIVLMEYFHEWLLP